MNSFILESKGKYRFHPTWIMSLAVALTIVGHSVLAAAPEFTGTWTLDPAKSESVPPGIRDMKVKQTADRIEVELKVSGPQGERVISDLYLLNGEEAEFTPAMMGRGEAKKGKRISRRSADGNGFDATEEAMVEDAAGVEKIKGKRSWRLSPDGKVLTVLIEIEDGMKSKRVFLRQ